MLLDQLSSDLIVSMKAHDTSRTETLRFLIAAVKKFEIDTYLPGSDKKLTDDDTLKIIRKQVKTHEESIAAFTKGNRPDLVEKETAELKILRTYLPAEIGDEEVRKVVKEVIATGATNFGQVMGMSMKKLAGQVGGDRVQTIVKQELNKEA